MKAKNARVLRFFAEMIFIGFRKLKKFFLSILNLFFAVALFSETEVIVSINQQKTYIYKNGYLSRTLICATGKLDGDNDTPFGDYLINESGQKRGKSFFSKTFGEGAMWWVGFIGGVYLFHSVPTDENGQIIKSQEHVLGVPASHGCVRHSVKDAKWFYDNVANGSTLHIIENFSPTYKLSDAAFYKGQLIPRDKIGVWLLANGRDYKNANSTKSAVIRAISAINGAFFVKEKEVKSALESAANLKSALEALVSLRGGDGKSAKFTKEILDFEKLTSLALNNPSFRGAALALKEMIFVLPSLKNGQLQMWDASDGKVKILTEKFQRADALCIYE